MKKKAILADTKFKLYDHIGSETATEYVFQHWMEMGAT